MGKISLTGGWRTFNGRVGGFVYRRRRGEIIVGERPVPSLAPPTEAQVRVRDKFTKGAAYAEAVVNDPVRADPYERRARGTPATAFALAVGDYMHPPEVKELDLTAYHGQVGDVIKIDADDDFGVVSVKVTLKNAAGVVIEQGQATLVEGFWIYRGTTVVPTDQNIAIEAEASDRPNNSRTLSDIWHA